MHSCLLSHHGFKVSHFQVSMRFWSKRTTYITVHLSDFFFFCREKISTGWCWPCIVDHFNSIIDTSHIHGSEIMETNGWSGNKQPQKNTQTITLKWFLSIPFPLCCLLLHFLIIINLMSNKSEDLTRLISQIPNNICFPDYYYQKTDSLKNKESLVSLLTHRF